MTELAQNSAFAQAVVLLTGYGFDLRGYRAEEVVNKWLKKYKIIWVRLAVIEALYQGRYKAVSVEHILCLWLRRGNPHFHHNREFERLICSKLPQYLVTVSESSKKLAIVSDLFTGDRVLNLPEQSFGEEIESSLLSVKEQERLRLALSIAHKQARVGNSYNQPTQQTPSKIRSENKGKEIQESPAPYQANWLRCGSDRHPIHRFTPIADASGFYRKLKAVALRGSSSERDTSIFNEKEANKGSF